TAFNFVLIDSIIVIIVQILLFSMETCACGARFHREEEKSPSPIRGGVGVGFLPHAPKAGGRLRRAPFSDNSTPACHLSAFSDQATPRHPRVSIYRCFLPDLTDFRRLPPRGTRSSTLLNRRSPTMPYLEREFNPAEASCGLQGIA